MRFVLAQSGLSPPTRGNPLTKDARRCYARSIPAHAGEPLARLRRPRLTTVYPRPRGGTRPRSSAPLSAPGLSPPTRGNPTPRAKEHPSARSIPAHAGEPTSSKTRSSRGTVYPRPRGGTLCLSLKRVRLLGLSPPTRGNHRVEQPRPSPARSIPAHAGEPVSTSVDGRATRVYPRPRGGTAILGRDEVAAEGLSPPTRGNRVVEEGTSLMRRSIPAHAGEPASDEAGRAKRPVYPRPRGGTPRPSLRPPLSAGLSPPTRGNQTLGTFNDFAARSIPAHAGEPISALMALKEEEVYPRPRGGTVPYGVSPPSSPGLSPPTRGNRLVWRGDRGRWRSIPAHAGEPSPQTAQAHPVSVYPRPRGGTELTSLYGALTSGLSPPTRGNRLRRPTQRHRRRSIPAHAGEPYRADDSRADDEVYPRPRGGTDMLAVNPIRVTGLSPPTRGNPAPKATPTRLSRSIPAHAGEPEMSALVAPRRGVYPRPRGGTRGSDNTTPALRGLSPPTRGNLAYRS